MECVYAVKIVTAGYSLEPLLAAAIWPIVLFGQNLAAYYFEHLGVTSVNGSCNQFLWVVPVRSCRELSSESWHSTGQDQGALGDTKCRPLAPTNLIYERRWRLSFSLSLSPHRDERRE